MLTGKMVVFDDPMRHGIEAAVVAPVLHSAVAARAVPGDDQPDRLIRHGRRGIAWRRSKPPKRVRMVASDDGRAAGTRGAVRRDQLRRVKLEGVARIGRDVAAAECVRDPPAIPEQQPAYLGMRRSRGFSQQSRQQRA